MFFVTQKCMYCNNTRTVECYIPYDWLCDNCKKQLNEKGSMIIENGKARVIKTETGMIYEPLYYGA